MKQKRKLLSLLLTLCLILGLLPTAALAQDLEAPTIETISDTEQQDEDENENGMLLAEGPVEVTTLDGLKQALSDAAVTEIVLAADIELDDTMDIDSKTVTIDGGNHTITSNNSGNTEALMFEIKNSGNLTLKNITLDGEKKERNGAILSNSSGCILTLDNTKVTGGKNVAVPGEGGGIWSQGTLIIKNKSEISGNTANYNGGGIYSSNTLEINDSTISGNTGNNGGGIYSNSTATLEINHSEISGNTADYNGGGIFSSRALNINHSTISGNSADHGGGIFSYGSTFKSQKITFINNNVTFDNYANSISEQTDAPAFLLQPESKLEFLNDTTLTGGTLKLQLGEGYDIGDTIIIGLDKLKEENGNPIDPDAIILWDKNGNPLQFEQQGNNIVLLESSTPAPPPTPAYSLTVNGGTGEGRYTSFSKRTVTADAPPYGFVFDHWDIDTEVTFLEDTTLESPEIKFYMPSHAVTLTAVYRENTVLVTGGTGSGNYDIGEIVTITPEIPKGFTFDHWESETELDFTENTSETDGTAKFIMGDRPVEITAIFVEQEDENKRRNDGRIGTLYYSITAEPTNHGTITTDPQRATRGQSVTVTVFPDNGYLLDTISITEQNGTAIDFTQESETTYTFVMPKAKVTVSAAFTEDGNLPIPEPTHTPEKTMLPFSDVLETDWYYDAVLSVYENNIMSGTTETTFSPNEPTSRGMLVAILYRMSGENYPNEETIFTDVSTDLYYNTAVAWAVDKGIASGIGNNLFSPNTPITREQLAVFLYQYALYTGNAPSTEGMAIREFTDADTISQWAVPAVQYCLNSGILSGNPDGTFSPRDNATRAEVASVLVRFLEQ